MMKQSVVFFRLLVGLFLWLVLFFDVKGQVQIQKNDGDTIRVVSYNLLFEKKLPQETDRQWANRKKTVIKYFTADNFDIIGTQEALTWQVDDLLGSLPDFDKTGLDLGGGTRDAGAENAALFYRKKKLALVDAGDFWFSETPEVGGSHSWNAGYPRKCTWAKFRINTSGKEFYLFNSHFYVFPEGHEAKRQCAVILKNKIQHIAGRLPVICTGDFNAEPGTETLSLLLDDGYLKDSKSLSPRIEGPEGTYHGFNRNASPRTRIDYVLVSDSIRVLSYRVIDDELKNGHFGSDHLPVEVEVAF